MKYYPGCAQLGCPNAAVEDHICRFVPVMQPFIPYENGTFGTSTQTCMGQKPLAIILPYRLIARVQAK